MIRVVLHQPLPKVMGISQNLRGVTLDVPFSPGADLGIFFAELAKKYPGFAELADSSSKSPLTGVIISLNGKVLPLGKWPQNPLSDGDEIALMFPYMGG